MTVMEIIAKWPKPSLRYFADDIGEDVECVKGWRNHNSIPAGAIEAVVAAAAQRGIAGVTRESILAEAAKVRRERKLRRRRRLVAPSVMEAA